MDCAFREVREVLMPLHTCDVVASDRFTVHRECATNLHSTRLYLPSDFWQRRVPTPEACYEECRRARGCAAFTYVLTQQHKPSEYACFLKQRGFEAGAAYSGGTASGIVEK